MTKDFSISDRIWSRMSAISTNAAQHHAHTALAYRLEMVLIFVKLLNANRNETNEITILKRMLNERFDRLKQVVEIDGNHDDHCGCVKDINKIETEIAKASSAVE